MSFRETSKRVKLNVDEIHKCDQCDSIFLKKCGLASHVLWKHHRSRKPSKKQTFCETCGKEFGRNDNLQRHQNVCLKIVRNKVKCSLCDFRGDSRKLVNEHYYKCHDVTVRERYLEFDTFDEFLLWKEQYEKDTKSRFVKPYGTKRLKDGQKVYRYTCHRDGRYFSKGVGIRNIKKLGTNKINSYCPAEIKAIVDENTTKVHYIDTHVGHDIEMDRMVISKSDKVKIAEKLVKKVPFKQILDDICDSVTSDELNRIHLLTPRDVRNIAESFNVNDQTVLRDDGSGMDAWVEHVRMKLSLSVIRCYKPKGINMANIPQLEADDFFLVIMNDTQSEILKEFGNGCICLDRTEGSDSNDIQLYTLTVLDDTKRAFPCCFLFSNKSDSTAMELFFQTVKDSLRDTIINPKTFMSDIDENIYDGWCAVFGPVKRHLFCTWLVQRDWKHNLSKIKNHEKQIITYKKIKTIMYERDMKTFNALAKKVHLELDSDVQTRHFSKYFKRFLNCSRSWAYCFRKEYETTNMNVGNMEDILKYLDGEKITRIQRDKLVLLLMRTIREKLFEQLITLQMEKLPYKLADLRKKHSQSLKITQKGIKAIDDRSWTVSATGKSFYTVKQNNVNDCTCELRCIDCKTCVHAFSCNCMDYSIKWNPICEHIHRVSMFLKEHNSFDTSNDAVNSHLDLDDESDMSSDAGHSCASSVEEIAVVREVSDDAVSLEKKKTDVLDIFLKTFNKIRNEEQLNAVKKHITVLKSVVNALAEVESD
ncbi:hypothetical protein NQ315_005598 [Exocentrus adspersus]|uniref:C2H2-type domain-containing protein n=1 Tax=Exocentrus adspersus TaxID=1586481 RepID=A0AAV8VU42_9CUCU|nr:hypothetical protein NQ315_005598 [Exocentrus adspersus]